MTAGEGGHESGEEGMELELRPEDEALWRALAPRLLQPGRAGLCAGEETARALEQACPPSGVAPAVRRRLDDVFARASGDLDFLSVMETRRRPGTLGDYLAFLRQQAGLSVAEAARRYRIDFQLLTSLERDRVEPERIPGRALGELIRRLRGSLELTQRLILTTVRAPRFVPATGRDSLYRKGVGASRTGPGDEETTRENPRYREEVEAARRLLDEVRAAWR
jgi:hypothetical protein